MDYKFKVGDAVVLLRNTNDNKNHIGWMDSMDELVGGEFIIKQRRIDNTTMYKLDGDEYHWWYDEEWLALAAHNENIDTSELDQFFSEF